MKTHAIIPIFIPHRGCGHSCVFCNQRAITARQPDVSPSDVRGILDTWLSTTQRLETVEAAFYGGSFTGLPLEEQAAFLAVAKEYKDRGLIHKIHLSTRPDYIDERILQQLKDFDVDIIELGVQSFDPDVLRLSRRGHTPEDVYSACEQIKAFGFTLGIQLMIGLPGDSREKCIASAQKTVELAPSLARLYPTVVLRDTELARMYEAGTYHPLSNDEAVSITKDMYRILDDAGITILRVGLKSTDLISDSASGGKTDLVHGTSNADASSHSANGGKTDSVHGASNADASSGSAVLGGTFHPAFRQLVEGEIAKEDLETQLQTLLREHMTESNRKYGTEQDRERAAKRDQEHVPTITFSSCGESFSNMIGNSRCNKKYFAQKYPSLHIRYAVNNSLPRGRYQADFSD